MKDNKLAEIVGRNIAERRRQLGMTQEELGRKLGTNVLQDSVSRLEHGRTEPRFNRLQLIASILQCRVADLFLENDEELEAITARFAEIIKPYSAKTQTQIVDMVEQMIKIFEEN